MIFRIINRKYLFAIAWLMLLTGNLSCKKFVEVGLSNTRVSSELVFTSDMTATAAALGMYETMGRISSFGASGAPSSVSAVAGVSSDEFVNYYLANNLAYQNELVPNDGVVFSIWSTAYNTIYTANAVIEGVAASTDVSASVAGQLTGEAKFMRAFCHFYLVNLYGDIPSITSTDYRANATAARRPVAEVYEQIVTDLKEAQQLLPVAYVSENRARPNKWTATALLSRAYLYLKDWSKAEETASQLIGIADLKLENNLDPVFLTPTKEAIWQLASGSPTSMTTFEGNYFTLIAAPAFQTISNNLLTSFEAGDARRNKWVGSYTQNAITYYFPYKYKTRDGSSPLKEHSVIFRLGEQYLVRAEARAQQDKLDAAKEDLNNIRNRAGLANTTAVDKASLLSAIGHERQVELFSEWGHRWFDLKRTNIVNTVLGAIKTHWQPIDALFPIPATELNNNPKLVQNPGY